MPKRLSKEERRKVARVVAIERTRPHPNVKAARKWAKSELVKMRTKRGLPAGLRKWLRENKGKKRGSRFVMKAESRKEFHERIGKTTSKSEAARKAWRNHREAMMRGARKAAHSFDHKAAARKAWRNHRDSLMAGAHKRRKS